MELLNDPYASLGQSQPLMVRLENMYRILREFHSGIHRFALTMYNPDDDSLSSFLYESDSASPLVGYSTHLSDVPSLLQLAQQPAIRIINDMHELMDDHPSVHTKALLSHGYRASFTMPVMSENRLLGFLFLNSEQKDYFSPEVTSYCSLWAHLISQVIATEQIMVERMQGIIKFATEVAGRRSIETHNHVLRMAQYSRLIARQLQYEEQLSDDYIEYLTLFAPMHDIGKIGIPDSILHKPGPLTTVEYSQMREHVNIGKDIIEKALHSCALGEITHAEMLRNIVYYHHEKMNGKGYLGLQGKEAIPLEARIIAVADVLDALLNKRSYKEAWSMADSLKELEKMAEDELDKRCVEAIIQQQDKILEIQHRYRE